MTTATIEPDIEVVGVPKTPAIKSPPKLTKKYVAEIILGQTKRNLLVDIAFLSRHIPKDIWDYKHGQWELTPKQCQILVKFRHYKMWSTTRKEALYKLSEDLKQNGI